MECDNIILDGVCDTTDGVTNLLIKIKNQAFGFLYFDFPNRFISYFQKRIRDIRLQINKSIDKNISLKELIEMIALIYRDMECGINLFYNGFICLDEFKYSLERIKIEKSVAKLLTGSDDLNHILHGFLGYVNSELTFESLFDGLGLNYINETLPIQIPGHIFKIHEKYGIVDGLKKNAYKHKIYMLCLFMIKHNIKNEDIDMHIGSDDKGKRFAYIYFNKKYKTLIISDNDKDDTTIFFEVLSYEDFVGNDNNQSHKFHKGYSIPFDINQKEAWFDTVEELLFYKRTNSVIQFKYDLKSEILKLIPTVDGFLYMWSHLFQKFHIFGNGRENIGGFFGINLVRSYVDNDSGFIIESTGFDPIYNIGDRIRLAEEIYNKDLKGVAIMPAVSDGWKKLIRILYPVPDKFMKEKDSVLMEMNYYGKTIYDICNHSFLLNLTDPIGDLSQRALFARAIYGDGYEVINDFFSGDEKLLSDLKKMFPTEKYIMTASVDEFKSVLISGKSLQSIIKSLFNLDLDNLEGSMLQRALFARELYGEKDESVVSNLVEQKQIIGLIKEQIKSPDIFMIISEKKLKNMMIGSMRFVDIVRQIFRIPLEQYQSQTRERAIIARIIYGNDFKVIECEFRPVIKWIDQIKTVIPNPVIFMRSSIETLSKVNILGKNIFQIANLNLGVELINVHGNLRDKAILARSIYGGGHDVIECVFWDKDKWIDQIKSKYEDINLFMGLSIDTIIVHDKTINDIARFSFNLIFKLDITEIDKKKQIADVVYGVPNLQLLSRINKSLRYPSKKRWFIGSLQNKFRREFLKLFPTPESFMNSPSRILAKDRVKIYGKGFKYLSNSVFNLGHKNPLNYDVEKAELAREIYGYECHDIIECEFWGKKRWKIELINRFHTYKKFMSISGNDLMRYDFYGKKLVWISNNIFGLNITNFGGYIGDKLSLANYLFDRGLVIIENGNYNKQLWIDEIQKRFPTPESFMGMTYLECNTENISGRGFEYIGNNVFELELNNPGIRFQMAELAREIYGYECYDIIECEFRPVSRWINEIKRRIPSYDMFMGISNGEFRKYKIFGKHMQTIANSYMKTGIKDVYDNRKSRNRFAKIIYGEQFL